MAAGEHVCVHATDFLPVTGEGIDEQACALIIHYGLWKSPPGIVSLHFLYGRYVAMGVACPQVDVSHSLIRSGQEITLPG